MRRLFRHWWEACLLGLIAGIPAGVALEFARRSYNARIAKQIAAEFESNGRFPPLITDMLQPWVVPILTTVVFVVLALLIYALAVRVHRALHSEHAA
jgi:uncharacterized membrane-anchored protein YhcB (DUF1043 family)